MIGRSVAPNASNASWDSQTSNTWISPFVSRAKWLERPSGAPAVRPAQREPSGADGAAIVELGPGHERRG